ncbi:MAG: zinc-binding dehydrogenase [Nitriliruptorales bacterium]|nr:zinc-binding dehydrogenase [Nitriliruptorales bacterium]
MMQQAAVLEEAGGSLRIVDDLEIDQPRRGEALVALDAAGVCGSDLAVLKGSAPHPMPVVLGHEATGRIVARGDDDEPEPGLASGNRVILWLRPPCRACRMCIRGDAGLCERSGNMSVRGTLLDGRTSFSRAGQPVYRGLGIGAFTTQVVMPLAGLVPVPDDIPVEVAALLGCGVATGAGAVLNVARPQVGDAVMVFGAGGVGLAAAMLAAASGAGAVIIVDPAEHRREAALTLGATHALEGGDRNALRAQLRDALGATAIDVAIDAVGRSALVELGYRSIRQGGTVVAVGLQGGNEVVSLPGPLVPLSHKRVLGCFMGGIDPQRDLPRLFALHRRGVFPVDRLVSARRPLTEVGAALDDLANARGLRTVVQLAP